MRALVLGAACAVIAACGQRSGGGPNLATADDSLNYVVGYQIGTSLKQQGIPAPQERVMLRGMREALAGTKPALTEDQARVIVMGFQQKRMETAAAANTAEAEKFLADNAKQPGVKTTASGLQWKVVREGNGARPKPTSSVTVTYRGTLLNGTVFDSSTTTFALNQVIPGWSEAVQLMNAGAKYHFWIPARLAYGERGAGSAIGPNQALMFEVELLSFK
ncbi:MAG: FKBP-type peptidyl-prolyl cis-trans isomerase [Gemmatimonadetes bacterium]|nr:FKBP-type peptidyl-prolyl cis-trans isomerase [Gemmatimonadota bacterium]